MQTICFSKQIGITFEVQCSDVIARSIGAHISTCQNLAFSIYRQCTRNIRAESNSISPVGRRTSSEIVIRFALLSGLQSESFFSRNVRKVLLRLPIRRINDFSRMSPAGIRENIIQNAMGGGYYSCRKNLELLLNRAKYCSQHDKKYLFIPSDLSSSGECKCLASRIEVLRRAYK